MTTDTSDRLAGARVAAEDTPEEAAFRAEVREWMAANTKPRDVDDETGNYFAMADNSPEAHAAHVARVKDWQRKLYDGGWAGITDPLEQIDVAELYVPFSWYEPMWLEGHDLVEHGESWKLIEAGETNLGGKFPVNPSGGVLSSNPIGASGMLRFGEAALQVRGMAGEHQVDGATVALAQAYGGAAQYFAMWVVGSTQDAVEKKK